jgi:hypothetical protein
VRRGNLYKPYVDFSLRCAIDVNESKRNIVSWTNLRVRAERLFKVEVVLDENNTTNTIALTT